MKFYLTLGFHPDFYGNLADLDTFVDILQQLCVDYRVYRLPFVHSDHNWRHVYIPNPPIEQSVWDEAISRSKQQQPHAWACASWEVTEYLTLADVHFHQNNDEITIPHGISRGIHKIAHDLGKMGWVIRGERGSVGLTVERAPLGPSKKTP